jgi:hypothetical protein
MRMKNFRKIKFLESYGFNEQPSKVWKTWLKYHDLKKTPISISEHDLKTIKTERELLLVLDELNR